MRFLQHTHNIHTICILWSLVLLCSFWCAHFMLCVFQYFASNPNEPKIEETLSLCLCVLLCILLSRFPFRLWISFVLVPFLLTTNNTNLEHIFVAVSLPDLIFLHIALNVCMHFVFVQQTIEKTDSYTHQNEACVYRKLFCCFHSLCPLALNAAHSNQTMSLEWNRSTIGSQ